VSQNQFTKQDISYGGEYYKKIVSKSNGLFYTKNINRPLAWFFTKIFYRISPNTISLSAFFVLIFALVFFQEVDNYKEAVMLYLLVALNYVLDSVDGQVARLTGQGSAVGEWLDHSLDAIRLVLVNAFLINLIFNNSQIDFPSFFIFFCIIGQVGLYVAGILREKILKVDVSSDIKNSKSYSKLVFLALTPADYGIFIMLFILTANPDLLAIAYMAYGTYKIALLAASMFVIFKAGKKMHKVSQ